MSVKIPESSMRILQHVAAESGTSLADLTKNYEDEFYSDFVQADPQLKTDDDRHNYCAIKVQSDMLLRPKQSLRKIIPIGHEAPRLTQRNKTKRSTLYVIEQASDGFKFRRATCSGDIAEVYQKADPFIMYDVLAGQYSNSQDLALDERSKFDSGASIGRTPAEFMDIAAKSFNWQRIKIADAKVNPSRMIRTGSRQFVDTLDWRIVRGFISDLGSGLRDDGTEWGRYTLSDETVSGPPVVLPDGRILYPGLSTWISPWLMKWGKNSVCDFYGSIALDRDKSGKILQPSHATMNTYQLLPVYGRELPKSGV